MMKIFTSFFIFLFSYCCWAQSPYENAGTRSNPFLRLDVSPRVVAMGGTFTAIANDENSLIYNQGGLAKSRYSGVALNHLQWFEDIRVENLNFLYKMGKNLGVGIGIAYMGMPSIQGMDETGSPTSQQFDVSSSFFQLGVGYEVFYGVMIGLGAKYFNDNLAGFSADGFALDGGVLFETMVRGLNFGLSFQNVSGKIKYDYFNEKIPMTIRAGVAYKIPLQDLRFGMDIVKADDQDYQFNIGVEYVLLDYAVLRIGNQAISEDLLSPTFGLGVNIEEKYLIDYAFSHHEVLGATHRFGITFRFDLPPVIKSKRTVYNRYTTKVVMAPKGIRYEIKNKKMIIKWLSIPGAKYNVYARSDKNDPWKKLNSKPLFGTQMEFKQPTLNTKYFITVTTILNGIESAFENEIEISIE
jgi:hypothetical protein